MKIWLADSAKANLHYATEALAPRRAQLLISFHYFGRADIAELFRGCDPMPKVFLDSGAFSAATLGQRIDIGEYADYIERNLEHISLYANLDVIGDHEKTKANQRYLERRRLHPMPVFHAHEPWGALEEMIEEYDYIGLGGIAIKKTGSFAPWIKKCFEIAGHRRLHGFGVSNWLLLRALPWESVDHTSWGQGFRYGQVPVFDSKYGRFVKVNLRDPKLAWGHSRLLYQYGFSPNDACLWTRSKRPALCAVAAQSWMEAERWLTQWHKQDE